MSSWRATCGRFRATGVFLDGMCRLEWEAVADKYRHQVYYLHLMEMAVPSELILLIELEG